MLTNISYKVSAFADFSMLEPAPATVIDLLQDFTDYNLMPAVTDNLQIGSMTMPNFVFALEQNYKKIAIFNNRIDFLCIAKESEGFNNENIHQMTNQASDIIGRVLSKCGDKSHRLGIYKEFILYKLNSEKNKLFTKEKFGFIPYYKDSEIIECGLRTVARECIKIQDNMEELCNIITTLNRISGLEDPQQTAIDGYKIDFDLNTYQGNTTARFEKESLISFCNKLNEKSQILLKQIVGEQ